MSSPHDPVIEVSGNYSTGDYLGNSLQILAGGSVSLGNVTISGAGRQFNNSSVTLSDGTSLSLSGRTRPTLDVRTGTTRFFTTPTRNGTPTSANITIGTIQNIGGDVFLTNQYFLNISLPGGNIQVGEINASIFADRNGANSGSVTIDSRGNLTVNGEINTVTSPNPDLQGVIASNGGKVSLIVQNNITLNNNIESFVGNNPLVRGKGGNISLGSIFAISDQGNGGNVTLNTTGNITTKDINTNGAFRDCYVKGASTD